MHSHASRHVLQDEVDQRRIPRCRVQGRQVVCAALVNPRVRTAHQPAFMCQCLPKCQVKSTVYSKVVIRQSHIVLAMTGPMQAVTPVNRSRVPKSAVRCFRPEKTADFVSSKVCIQTLSHPRLVVNSQAQRGVFTQSLSIRSTQSQ